MSPAVSVAGTATAQDAPLPRNVTAVPLSSSPLATLPALARRLPDAGRKIALEPLAGSADALALAQLATQCANDHRILAVICADALATRNGADAKTRRRRAALEAAMCELEELIRSRFLEPGRRGKPAT